MNEGNLKNNYICYVNALANLSKEKMVIRTEWVSSVENAAESKQHKLEIFVQSKIQVLYYRKSVAGPQMIKKYVVRISYPMTGDNWCILKNKMQEIIGSFQDLRQFFHRWALPFKIFDTLLQFIQ